MLVCIKVDTKLLWWSARLFIIALALKKKKKTTSVMIFPILGVTLIADLTSVFYCNILMKIIKKTGTSTDHTIHRIQYLHTIQTL